MPKYLVKFPNPVQYLPDHFNGRDVTELVVNTSSVSGAITHALRVTRGDPGEMIVEPYNPDFAPPPVEVTNDLQYHEGLSPEDLLQLGASVAKS